MNARPLVLIAMVPFLMGLDLLRRKNELVEQGNSALQAGKAEDALGKYEEAVRQLPGDPSVHFNRGSALLSLKRFDDAAEAFLRATEAPTPALKSSAFYNLGLSFSRGNKWGEAVEAFKKSLRYNPGDLKAKWNLELALRKRKEEDQNKQGDKQKQGDKNKQQDDKGQQAENDPDQQGDEKSGDKEGEGDKNAQNEEPPKDQPDPQDQQGDQKQQEQQQARKDQQKPPEPGAQQPEKPEAPKNDQAKQAKQQQPSKDDKPGQKPSGDMAEIEAILDNLEKSPKALEQELARLRAYQRRPPAKDW